MDSIYNIDDPEDVQLKPFIILDPHTNSHPFNSRKIYIQEVNQEIKVGRSIAKNKVTTNNAIFDCKVLSRNHAVFWYSDKENKFFIKDTKSSNGTFVNDKKLLQLEYEEIFSGDTLKFGVDVVESTKKDGTVHGCIIACVHLFDANGIELISSNRAMVKINKEVFNEKDINKVRTLMQETTNRDSFVKSKLYDIQNIMDLTRNSALNCWQALIDEDKLLNKIDLLENKLSYFQKHCTENNLKIDIMKLQDEKLTYNNSAKKILQKANQEKIVAMNKLLEIEKKYSKTESNCCILREKNNESQKSFQELQAKYNRLDADFNLLQSKYDILMEHSVELEAELRANELINKDLSNAEKSKESGESDGNILSDNGYNMSLVQIENNNDNVITSHAFQLMQEKLLYIENQMEKLKNEKEFLNFFYIQSMDSSTKNSEIDLYNTDAFFVNSNYIINHEEELILYKTKYNDLLKENRKIKLELSNCQHIGKGKINKYLTIFISLLLILFAYFYNIS